MKNDVNYRDNGQTKEIVQIAQATCDDKKDIEKTEKEQISSTNYSLSLGKVLHCFLEIGASEFY